MPVTFSKPFRDQINNGEQYQHADIMDEHQPKVQVVRRSYSRRVSRLLQ